MDVSKRYFSASDNRYARQIAGEEDYDERTHRSAEINDAVRHLAEVIDMALPNDRSEGSRQKSIALTHLEDVQMHANRGLFAPGES